MADSTTLTKRVPKYVLLAESLRSEMECGTLAPGDQLPSFHDMMQRFNVAKNTIDKAHLILEREGLVRREQGRGIFVESAQKKKIGDIGLLFGPTYNDFYTDDLLSGIQEHAREAGLTVVLVDRMMPSFSKDLCGILLFGSYVEVTALPLPAEMPRVLMLEPAPIAMPNVVADDFNGTRLMARHLLDLGHRRISIMVAAIEDPYSTRRLAGYKAALEEFGVAFDERLCFSVTDIQPDENNFLYGEEYMNAWLKQGWADLGSTAIMATHDISAIGTIKVLTAKGYKIPRDISVVGFDGTRLSDLSTPRLTTVKVPLHDIGARAIKMILELIQGGSSPNQQIVLPVKFKPGESTALCPKGA